MAKYTILLDDLIRSGFDVGLSDYEIFDETYRPSLNQKLLEHYKYYEIGQETPYMFRDVLNRTMREIMPYYNQLYKSALLKISPLIDHSDTETNTKGLTKRDVVENGREYTTDSTKSNTQTRDLTRTSDGKRVFSDTPQNGLTLADVEADLYASAAQADNGVNTDEGNVVDAGDTHTVQTFTGGDTTDTTLTENLTRKLDGFSVSQSRLLLEFRATFRNLDMEVIEHKEVAQCFMLIL